MSERFNKLPALVAAVSIGVALPSSVEAENLQSSQQEANLTQDAIRFSKIGSFALGDRKVTVFNQKGFKGTGSYSFSNLKHAAENADREARRKLVLPFSIIDIASGGTVPLPVDVTPSEGSHVFKIAKDPSALIQASKAKNPPSLDVSGFTEFDPLNRQTNTTFLAPPKQKYEEGLRHETLGINTENCNNLIDLKFSKAVEGDVQAMTHNVPAQLRVVYRFAYETVCNSYGYLVADKEAGQTYNQYKLSASHRSLNFVPGFIFPLVTFPKRAWDSVDIKTRH